MTSRGETSITDTPEAGKPHTPARARGRAHTRTHAITHARTPLWTFHTRTTASSDPETAHSPSLDSATAVTAAPVPCSTCTTLPTRGRDGNHRSISTSGVAHQGWSVEGPEGRVPPHPPACQGSAKLGRKMNPPKRWTGQNPNPWRGGRLSLANHIKVFRVCPRHTALSKIRTGSPLLEISRGGVFLDLEKSSFSSQNETKYLFGAAGQV